MIRKHHSERNHCRDWKAASDRAADRNLKLKTACKEACGKAHSPCPDDNRERVIPMRPAVRGSAGKASWMCRCQCIYMYVCVRVYTCLKKGNGTVCFE